MVLSCGLLQLLGCTIVVIGIWILVDPHSILSRQQHSNTAFHQFLDDSSHFGYQTVAAYLLIVVGVVVIVIGFLGCCGALRHSEWMLITVRCCRWLPRYQGQYTDARKCINLFLSPPMAATSTTEILTLSQFFCEHPPIQITVCGRFARSEALSVLKISFDFEIEKVRTKIAVFGNAGCMAAV